MPCPRDATGGLQGVLCKMDVCLTDSESEAGLVGRLLDSVAAGRVVGAGAMMDRMMVTF